MVDFNIFGHVLEAEEAVLCELCSRMIPIEKYEQHINYFCKSTMAECPHCFDSYPNSLI